jgi:hypothetical protein
VRLTVEQAEKLRQTQERARRLRDRAAAPRKPGDD